jgi:hypothetical protein
MEETAAGAAWPGDEAPISILQCTFPPFDVKSVHPSVNLPSLCPSGNLAECSTELSPMIEFWAQGSTKPEPSSFVPLPRPKLPGDIWKPFMRLLHV